ncbi:DNA polymerase III subunit delta [Orbaceae bacterium ac157xtp]
MIKITPNQLNAKLEQHNDWRFYLTVGSDPYLQQLAQSQIQTKYRQLGFEQRIFTIDNQVDWNLIFDATQAMSLFSSQTLIVLQFGENALNVAITKKLEQLTANLSSDVNILISLAKMTKTQENATWLKPLLDQLIIVTCNTPEIAQLPQWINQQLINLNLKIEPQGIELLSYHYEGNLLALAQTLERLKLLYASANIVSYAQVEQNINDSAVFTPYQWVDAMLLGKTKRATHILQQLKMNDAEPLILLRVIQRELILLINLKKIAEKQSLKDAYDLYKVWQTRRSLITPYLNKTSLKQLYQILNKLTELEVTLKNDYSSPIWEQILAFSLLFTGSKTP